MSELRLSRLMVSEYWDIKPNMFLVLVYFWMRSKDSLYLIPVCTFSIQKYIYKMEGCGLQLAFNVWKTTNFQSCFNF